MAQKAHAGTACACVPLIHYNSNPPPTIKKLDTVATVNVVFALGPQTL